MCISQGQPEKNQQNPVVHATDHLSTQWVGNTRLGVTLRPDHYIRLLLLQNLKKLAEKARMQVEVSIQEDNVVTICDLETTP